MSTSSKATSALLALLIAAPAMAGPTIVLNGGGLAVGDVPAAGVCMATTLGAYQTTCTDLGDDAPNVGAAASAVSGTVRVRQLDCWLAGLGYLAVGDSVTHCVAWMTDADQTPECIAGTNVAVAGDADTQFSPFEGLSAPSSTVSLTSGGALVLMVSTSTDGAAANDSTVIAHCRAEIEVLP